jgi:hypothetical protein
MSPADVLARLRRFLLVFSVLLLGGSLVELFLVEHTEDAVQLIPFALCGLGALSALAALLKPGRATMWALRVCMLLVVAGSLFGVYEHVTHNFEFQKEVNPNATTGEMVRGALGGGNPLLAPGILAAAAVLALAATYRQETMDAE